MKKIKIILSLAILPAGLIFAQENGTKKNTTEMRTTGYKPERQVRQTVPKTEASGATNPDLNRPPSKNKTIASVDEPKRTNTIQRKYEYKGTKFAKVPLVGDLEYFGKNHEEMLNYTKKYHASRKKTFSVVKQRDQAGKIFALMDKIFDKHEIPHELKYLSVIESALNKNALSPVGAYGPWQFMPSTGKMMGLTVSSRRDDRADWSRSTHAACKYLTYLYNMFDDWLLVVASYNSGPRPVLNAIKRTGKNDFWSIKRYLPKETQNHVMAFVATATVFEYLPEYVSTGVPPDFDWKVLNKLSSGVAGESKVESKPKNPLLEKFSKNELAKMSIIKITDPIDLDYLSLFLEHDRAELQRWNYDYIEFLLDEQTDKQYMLKIPKNKLEKFLANRDNILKESRRRLQGK